ncbi:hypothetical protein J2I47_07530 [Fibrella sp. HMF5335]|uniref:Uncharacterized protein n=1 Tax=Fibrella rubiginis TaxID=2817060 RepID=A0A939GGL7_9BACT|nr:hypothetical protein [Fibrella rubiginis]MBO0936396.1 hypothetical protein [Fibrella rubiginis]
MKAMILNQRDCELTSLGRIIIQIKTYRQTHIGKEACVKEPALDNYLHEHLSASDWKLWLKLHVTPDAYNM